MTPQAAAALRELVTKWREFGVANTLPCPDVSSTEIAQGRRAIQDANELAAVLTQEGAAEQPFGLDDDSIRKLWQLYGGKFHGPNVEHGSMEETKLLPFLRLMILSVPPKIDCTAPVEPRAAEGAGLNLATGLNDTKTTAAAEVPAGGDAGCMCPQHGNWIAAEDVKRMAREMDVAMHGENAAPAPSLCDVAASVIQHFKAAPRGGVTEAFLWAYRNMSTGEIDTGKLFTDRPPNHHGWHVVGLAEVATPPAAQALAAGPKARHWREAFMKMLAEPFVEDRTTAQEWDLLEQEARALAAKEAK